VRQMEHNRTTSEYKTADNKKRSFTAFVLVILPATRYFRRALPYVLVIETMEYTDYYKFT
jgi:hypothetical protein